MEAPRVKLSAVVHPNLAPKWLHRGWYGLAALAFFFGCLMLDTFPIAPRLLLVSLELWLVAPLVLRRSPYRAELELEPGALRVRPRFGLPFRIETRALEGASVAALDDVPVVTLAQRRRLQTSFELSRGTSSDELRRVLGIPSGGFGDLRWGYAPSPLDLVRSVGRLLGAVALLAVTVFPGAVPPIVSTSSTVLLALVALLVVVGKLTNGPLLVLSRDGVGWTDGHHPTFVSYADIVRVDDDGRGITIHADGDRAFVLPCIPTRRITSGLREGERTAMISHLRSAVARSKGRARVDEPAAYASDLARGSGSAAEWLARLDALAISHANAPAGYRGSTIPLEALWCILEDHDVEPAPRAAAARILSRISGEKAAARIDDAIASTHDDDARALMRALRDEDAQQALDEVERHLRLAGELTRSR